MVPYSDPVKRARFLRYVKSLYSYVDNLPASMFSDLVYFVEIPGYFPPFAAIIKLYLQKISFYADIRFREVYKNILLIQAGN